MSLSFEQVIKSIKEGIEGVEEKTLLMAESKETQPLWASVYLFVRGFGLVISKARGFKHEPAVHLSHPNCERVCTHTAVWGGGL